MAVLLLSADDPDVGAIVFSVLAPDYIHERGMELPHTTRNASVGTCQEIIPEGIIRVLSHCVFRTTDMWNAASSDPDKKRLY